MTILSAHIDYVQHNRLECACRDGTNLACSHKISTRDQVHHQGLSAVNVVTRCLQLVTKLLVFDLQCFDLYALLDLGPMYIARF
jgi:hypothetical protein